MAKNKGTFKYFDGGPVNYKPRTKAGIIHAILKKYVRGTFSGKEGIVVDDFNGVFGMVLQDALFIRFKKMDSTYSVRNLYTMQHAIDQIEKRIKLKRKGGDAKSGSNDKK